MIYFLTLLTTLCIQLGALDLPYNVGNFEDMALIKDYLFSSENVPNSFIWFADTPNAPYIVLRYSIQNDGSRVYNVGFPVSSFDSSVSSSVVITNGEFINNNDFYRGDISFIGWDFAQFVISADHSSCYLSGGYNQNRNYQTKFLIPTDNFSGVVTYQRVEGANSYSFYDNNGNLIFVNESIRVPTFGILGSFNSSGHSSGTNPLDELDSFSWSSSSPSFALSGHSVGVSQNQSKPDFSNPVQNLLGQIIDNSNKIISNIKGVGDYLGAIISNIREGFSAVFNGISQFNDNVISFYNYVTEPLDQDLVMDYVDDMSFMQLSSSISSAGSHISSSFSSVSNNQTLIFPIDLRNTIFSNAGIMYLDLSFLDDSKSIWQPLLIAFLYITLAFNILMALPSIIQGQSREGGKSD